MAVNRAWADEHPAFMTAFVRALDAVNADYRADPRSWWSDAKMLERLSRSIGGDPATIVHGLRLLKYPSLDEQASDHWLGGSEASGGAETLELTAEFLAEYGLVDSVSPTIREGVTDRWIKAAAGN